MNACRISKVKMTPAQAWNYARTFKSTDRNTVWSALKDNAYGIETMAGDWVPVEMSLGDTEQHKEALKWLQPYL